MKEKCFQFYILRFEAKKLDGSIESSYLFTAVDPAGEDMVNNLLRPWGANFWKYFNGLDAAIRKKGIWPWAIALFEREFRLAGHVVTIRQHPDDFYFGAYSMKSGAYSLEKYCVPSVSIILINNKEALAEAAGKSLLFEEAWHLLKDKPEELHWVCFPSSPPEAWVAEKSEGDDRLFLRTVRK